MTILLAAGERVPVDARVLKGQSDLDCSLVSGESIPQTASRRLPAAGRHAQPDGPAHDRRHGRREGLVPRRDDADDGGGGIRTLGLSAHRRSCGPALRSRRPPDRLVTFIGWMVATGDVHRALTIAIAVLIITCPCALGLAVPMVQVVAARRLFEQGIMVKDGGALERLAEVDTVVFDKTGTLTLGEPQLIDGNAIDPRRACAGCRDRVALPPSVFARARRRRPSTSPWRRSRWIACPSIPARDWKLRSVQACTGLADPNGRSQTMRCCMLNRRWRASS